MPNEVRESFGDFESSLFDASDGHKLVELIRKKKGVQLKTRRIFDDVPTSRPSLHVEILRLEDESEPAAIVEKDDQCPVQHPVSENIFKLSRRNSFSRSITRLITSPQRKLSNIGRRTLLKEFEKTLQESRFLPPTCSTPHAIRTKRNEEKNLAEPCTSFGQEKSLEENIVCTPITISDEDSPENRNSENSMQNLIQQNELLCAILNSEENRRRALTTSDDRENNVPISPNRKRAHTPTTPTKEPRRTFTIHRHNVSACLSPSKAVRDVEENDRQPLVIKTPDKTNPSFARKLVVTPEQRKLLLSRFGRRDSLQKAPYAQKLSQIPVSSTDTTVHRLCPTNIDSTLVQRSKAIELTDTAQFVEDLRKNTTTNYPVNQTFNQAPTSTRDVEHQNNPIAKQNLCNTQPSAESQDNNGLVSYRTIAPINSVLTDGRSSSVSNNRQEFVRPITPPQSEKHIDDVRLEDIVPPPEVFCDPRLDRLCTSQETDLIDEISSDRVSLESKKQFPKKARGRPKKVKMSENVKQYLEANKRLSKNNLLCVSKRKLYCKGQSDKESCDELHPSDKSNEPTEKNPKLHRKSHHSNTKHKSYKHRSAATSKQTKEPASVTSESDNEKEVSISLYRHRKRTRLPKTDNKSTTTADDKNLKHRTHKCSKLPSKPNACSEKSEANSNKQRDAQIQTMGNKRDQRRKYFLIKKPRGRPRKKQNPASENAMSDNSIAEFVPKGRPLTENIEAVGLRRSKREKKKTTCALSLPELYQYLVMGIAPKKLSYEEKLSKNTSEIASISDVHRCPKENEMDPKSSAMKEKSKRETTPKIRNDNSKSKEKSAQTLEPTSVLESREIVSNSEETWFQENQMDPTLRVTDSVCQSEIVPQHPKPTLKNNCKKLSVRLQRLRMNNTGILSGSGFSSEAMVQKSLTTKTENQELRHEPQSAILIAESNSGLRQSQSFMPPPASKVVGKKIKSCKTRNHEAFRKLYDESIADISTAHLNNLFDQMKNSSMKSSESRLQTTRTGQVSRVSCNLPPLPIENNCKNLSVRLQRLKVKNINNTEKVSDSGSSSEAMDSAKKYKKKDILMEWLVQILNTEKNPIKAQMGLASILDPHSCTYGNSDELLFQEHCGIDYAFYKTSKANQKIGYLRFKPHTQKDPAVARMFEMSFVLLCGTIEITVNQKSMIMKNGDMVTVFLRASYSLKNHSNDRALVMMIRSF